MRHSFISTDRNDLIFCNCQGCIIIPDLMVKVVFFVGVRHIFPKREQNNFQNTIFQPPKAHENVDSKCNANEAIAHGFIQFTSTFILLKSLGVLHFKWK